MVHVLKFEKHHMGQLPSSVCQHSEFTSLTTLSHYRQAAGPIKGWDGLLKTMVVRQHSERMEFYLIGCSLCFESTVSPKVRRHWSRNQEVEDEGSLSLLP